MFILGCFFSFKSELIYLVLLYTHMVVSSGQISNKLHYLQQNHTYRKELNQALASFYRANRLLDSTRRHFEAEERWILDGDFRPAIMTR